MGKIYEYKFKDGKIQGTEERASFRTILCQGRRGINATSINSRLVIPRHNLNEDKGSLSIWIMSLEDLSAAVTNYEAASKHNPYFNNYTILSDCEEVRDFNNAVFSFNWSSYWYPMLYAKFYQGNIYDNGYRPKQRAIVGAGHFAFHRENWYQFLLSWDKKNKDYRIYVNGILVALSDRYPFEMEWEKCGDKLYAGNPTYCISDICFYENVILDKEAKQIFEQEAIMTSDVVMDELKNTFLGDNVQKFDWQVGMGWTEKLSLKLTEEKDLDMFYVQGCKSAPKITENGLLVDTPKVRLCATPNGVEDLNQVYLWTNQSFEGDLYVEFEFNPLEEGGLALLMLNASGMQREDFMKDYPLRTTGSMSMVCWEDVRNYHWEFYRETRDTRNEVENHVLLKNPWQRPLGMQCMKTPLQKNRWHKLQYLQEGSDITCVLDSRVVIKAVDDSFINNGPCLNFGRIAIRCMLNSKIIFRNLKIYNKSELIIENGN